MSGKGYLFDIYSPCLCGSGKKFKFCCYKKEDMRFHNPGELHVYTEKNLQKPSFCLHEDDQCSGGIIRAHSIQNNKILSKLAVDGHVYTIEFSPDSFAGSDLIRSGRNVATTTPCFCNHHDNVLFRPIERKDYSGTDEQNFLYCYRAFAKEYYNRLQLQNNYRFLFKLMPRQLSQSRDQILGTDIMVKENEITRETLNTYLDRGDYSCIETISLSIDYEVGFATSYVWPPAYDFSGNDLNDQWSLDGRMKNIYVSIFSEAGNTHLLFSWLSVDSEFFASYKQQLLSLYKDGCFQKLINNMLACQSDNFALSPRLVHSWSESERKGFLTQIKSIFFGTKGIQNIDLEIEKNLVHFPCRFDLFKRIQ